MYVVHYGVQLDIGFVHFNFSVDLEADYGGLLNVIYSILWVLHGHVG
jgi:hypothetical protein